MSDTAKEIRPINIEDEMRNSYLDYAMSVIIGRALPDVRDGLKPVHRRALFSMHESGYDWNKPYRKSARVVGDVIGKYHPHGDTAVYDTIVRMAQPFSLRYTLIDGQGNFGSVDGDSPAAMRYTEVRMKKIAHELLADLDKETVDFVPNYDGTEHMPSVLPTRVPNLLLNGSSGIAVGMATNIPPHNLTEVIEGCLAFIEDEDISIEELIQYIPGPDFPTAAIINGRKGIIDAYKTGRGKVSIRAKADVEVDEKSGRESIIVHEIPYQVNKARLIEKIAELVKDKKLEGITGLRDESDKDGMRIVIEIKRDAVAEVVLNNLYAQTQMQTSFGINMVALHQGQPKLMNLKQILKAFVNHRREVVTRRTIYELKKARDRAHILEGLAIALANIDEVIETIRQAANPADAKLALLSKTWLLGDVAKMLEATGDDIARPEWLEADFGIKEGRYRLTEQQAQAILDLRLHKLTGLEHERLLEEYKGLLINIAELLHILNSPDRLMEVIREELEAIKNQYQDERRTEIRESEADINYEDLITQEDVVVTLSHQGYVKYQPLSDYEAQRRGGKGKSATNIKDEDFVERLLVANTHDTILCFSSTGRLYWLKVYQLPEASRAARGRPIINVLPLEANERITAILPVKEYTEGLYVFMAMASGFVKKTALTEFSKPRKGGIKAVNLMERDELIGVDLTNGQNEIMLFSSDGRVVRFLEEIKNEEGQIIKGVRPLGRSARGVKGMKLKEGAKLISLIVPKEEGDILTATENGYGKRTPLALYPQKSRGTQGVFSMKMSERNGAVIGAVQVVPTDEIMLITNGGTLVRTRVGEVSRVGRNTQGVTLIRTRNDELLVGLERVAETEELDEEEKQALLAKEVDVIIDEPDELEEIDEIDDEEGDEEE